MSRGPAIAIRGRLKTSLARQNKTLGQLEKRRGRYDKAFCVLEKTFRQRQRTLDPVDGTLY
jgi:hypothetical protein